MNWMLIETSPKLRAATLLAVEQRREIAAKAHGCVKWLKAQGFSVIRVERGAVGPRILIQASPLCKQLDGAIAAYSRAATGERRYSFTFRFECEVRWLEAEQDAGGAA